MAKSTTLKVKMNVDAPAFRFMDSDHSHGASATSYARADHSHGLAEPRVGFTVDSDPNIGLYFTTAVANANDAFAKFERALVGDWITSAEEIEGQEGWVLTDADLARAGVVQIGQSWPPDGESDECDHLTIDCTCVMDAQFFTAAAGLDEIRQFEPSEIAEHYRLPSLTLETPKTEHDDADIRDEFWRMTLFLDPDFGMTGVARSGGATIFDAGGYDVREDADYGRVNWLDGLETRGIVPAAL